VLDASDGPVRGGLNPGDPGLDVVGGGGRLMGQLLDLVGDDRATISLVVIRWFMNQFIEIL
jgi:hypothetical protein